MVIENTLSDRNSKGTTKFDPVLILLSIAIFAVLIFMAYLLFSVLSMVAISIGFAVMLYQILSLKTKTSKFKYGTRFPSAFLFFLIGVPIGLGVVIGYDAYSVQESIVKAILLWGLTLTFWSTLLFVPLALFSKYREATLPALKDYPRITVLVPAYNEEKVIARTIEGLIETSYPNKEVIVIDDGSKDKTFSIMNNYKNKVKILHKENGGKASAINFGLAYSSGEIIVIVDADTIIGRDSLIYLAEGFLLDENVAAVAGNIRVRNRKNWFTRCQALEYIAGIQIARRALDFFGAISVVPGSLGAFRRKTLEEIGSYHKDTLVEDFDVTIKILKTKLVISGSSLATAYTEAPEDLLNLYRQRRRWYGGNLQVFTRHKDALTNPRFGLLQRLVFPYLIFSSIVMPFVGFITIANAIYSAIFGDVVFVIEMFAMFAGLQCLQSALAVRMDREDPRLIPYGIFLVAGYKQILDILLIRAIFENIFHKEMKWTSAERVGV